eukprot:CAMPEP_0201593420 /NCGR_PEP_ID=MMETSP0190_2-20130828/191025_1 /ASSEMBLY_ACC=CAM_ASM_000263 /TAXON_ID=37353 /ORGANISM="Rosalina sp." /LENGTH=1007 /DNA_ID=CAMNT_0048052595 /DNA_START=113 /DNA_END=3138 /DNA_ORIENTATION=-
MQELISIICVVASWSIIHAQPSDEMVTIYSSCNEVKENGLYYIAPMADYPQRILPVICSNGYAMIDGSLDMDTNTLRQFITSWDEGPWQLGRIFSRLDDLSTFDNGGYQLIKIQNLESLKIVVHVQQAPDDTKFRVAKNCGTCATGSRFGDNTVYYTDSHTFCVSKYMDPGCISDKDSWYFHPESCNQCDALLGDLSTTEDGYDHWINCGAVQLDADHPIDHDHNQCVAKGLAFHPAISYIRDACTCYQPLEVDGPKSYQVPVSVLPVISWTAEEACYQPLEVDGPKSYQVPVSVLPVISWTAEEAASYANIDYIHPNIKFAEDVSPPPVDKRDTNIVYLYKQDFIDGTYRIRETGTYILMEDIAFNFNPPSEATMNSPDFSPNSIDDEELYWYPTKEQAQADSNGEYPGLYNFQGAYTLDFFAGITVEVDYVTIDLNGHTISQDPIFYFQQRHFILISIATAPFMPGQGTANWGAEIFNGNHVTIKNGELGLTAHHGIHGLNVEDLTITNIRAYDYDVAGIQCNGCNNVLISDCTVGPQNKKIPVLGRYTHARSFLPRLTQLSSEHGQEYVTFHGREPVTVNSLIYRLIDQMDMMYFHKVHGHIYDEDDPEWIATKKLFYNPSGWMDGGTSYGVALGGQGAQVVGIGDRPTKTTEITIQNLEIFGVGNKLNEKIRFSGGLGATRLIFFDAIDWVDVSDQVEDLTTSKYIGDAFTDLVFAIHKFVDSWYFLNSLYIRDSEAAYVFHGDSQRFADEVMGYYDNACGTDIQTHSSKGSIGFRADGVQGLNIDGLYIHDIDNWSDLGNSDWCGLYEGIHAVDEDPDIQYGYPGSRAHGMIIDYVSGSFSNIRIEGINSHNGEAAGLIVYKECNVTLENIQVDDIHAGSVLTSEEVADMRLPNLVPRACGVDIKDDTVAVINDDIGITTGNNIDGFETCYDDITDNDQENGMYFRHSKNMISENNNNDMNLILIGAIFCMVLGLYTIYRMNCLRLNKDGEYKSIDESTPLI